MSLPKPNLDDRRFQDIVDEAKRLIPHYCPGWTDHNVSDPGITLIELFAWMTEMTIYRLNRVPDKSYITFMELMGVRLQSPSAASTVLTFWLAAPPVDAVTIAPGTEVTTVQTASEQLVSFHTDGELVVRPPNTIGCLTSPDERSFEDQTWKLTVPNESFPAFNVEPRPGNAFYICDSQDLSNNILSLLIDCSIEGIGVEPTNPPLAWEAWCSDGWTDLERPERDDTGGLNKRGQVIIYLPPRMARKEIHGKQGYWVRCRHTPPQPGQPGYSASPQIHGIQAATLGGMAIATHATTIVGQMLGRSTGRPDQSFKLEYLPVLPRRPGETVEVQSDSGDWEAWTEREHFGESVPRDTHFMLDSVSGEVRFGPAIREPDGSERQYGAIPSRNAMLRFSRYRSGGGSVGNVGRHTLTVLRSTVPYVDRVTNRQEAKGGKDAESLEHAKMRAPQHLRTRFRAVTAEDYQHLAMEASPNVARAHCVQPRSAGAGGVDPGSVQVLLVPTLGQIVGRIQPEQLRLPQDLVQEVQAFLDTRRLLTAAMTIAEPDYFWVSIDVRIKARPEANLEVVRRDAAARLYRYLNPLVGGEAGSGWPFGRDLYVAEVYTVLQGTPGIAYIENVSLMAEGSQEIQPFIAVGESGLIASAEHRITVV